MTTKTTGTTPERPRLAFDLDAIDAINEAVGDIRGASNLLYIATECPRDMDAATLALLGKLLTATADSLASVSTGIQANRGARS